MRLFHVPGAWESVHDPLPIVRASFDNFKWRAIKKPEMYVQYKGYAYF